MKWKDVRRWRIVCLWAGAGAGILWSAAQAALLQDLRARVEEFSLDNGLRFLVVEQHDAPIFAYATCVDAGGVCEVPGITGLAHMFEHMAFKGTQTVGTTDYGAESQALDRVDAAWDAVLDERLKGLDADSLRLAQLEELFQKAQTEANRYVVSEEFSRILEENGARDLNAFTSIEATCYHYNLPSNRLELSARLEGDRLTQPVLREFYQERDVVRNERRMGVESRPIGRFIQTFLQTAFLAHPYGNGGIGHASDIESFRRRDAMTFFDKYYVGPNMTVVLVGDVTLSEVKKLAEKYFSGVSASPDPRPVITVEPVHTAEIRVLSEEDANPMVVIGWQCPAQRDPDFPAMELLMQVLGGGRSSRFYERLVKQEKVATMAAGAAGFPGSKYPSLAGVFVYVAADQDPLRAEALVYEEVDRLIASGPTPEEVAKVKTSYVADQVRELRNPVDLALSLAMADQLQGNWNRLFEHLDRIEAVTGADIQRVAAERLVKARRTVGIMTKKSAAGAAAN